MRLTDVGTLDPEARASMRGEIRRQLAHFRGNATQRQRAAARRLVASGGLADARMEGGGATAAVQDEEGAFEVRVDLTDPAAARCGCAAFRRRASCAHVVGLLEAALASLEAPAAPSSGGAGAATNAPTWLQRLEGITASIESAGAPQIDPWQAAAAQAADAPDVTRHVLRFAERRGVVEARLERQVRRGPAGQKGERWVNVPFAGEDAPRALGPAHDRVTAIACGASDAGWMNDPTLRSVAVAVVRREIAAPLLEAAASAGPLVLGEDADAEPLELDLERPVALELEAEDESAARWRVHGWLRIGRDDRVPASSIVRAARDGVCALRNPARVVLLPEGDTSLVATDLARAPLEVPREEAPTLCALAGAATFVGDELAEVAAPAPPTPCLRADSPLDVEGNVRVSCEVEFDYGGTRVRVEDRTRVIPSLDGRSVPRRPRIEAEALARFRELGGRPSPAMPSASMKGGHGNATVPASSFLGMVAALVDEGWNVVAKDCLVRRATSLEASVSSGVDWFELEGGVRFGDEVIPFPEALLAARDARGFVRLGDGSTGLLPQRWLERWQLATLGDPEGDALRFSNSQSWVLTALADLRKEEAGDPLAPLRDRFAALTAPAPTDPPAEFTGTLRPYQREGLGWLLGLDAAGLSGCLADDMGLGKTVQVLAYLVTRASAGANDGRHSLVVAPRSLVFNWLAEAGRFAPSIQVVDFTGPGRWMRFQATPPGSLLVTTYGALRNDAERLAETELDVVVLDESQAIKSRRSQTACAARALRARRRLTLTGTPVENHLGELWSQMEFLNPGMLGAHSAFERLGAPQRRDDLVDEGRALLSRALRPFLLRRTKEAVLDDLPPKTEQVLRAPLVGAQEATYQELSRYYRSELTKSKGEKRREREEDLGAEQMMVLAALTRLRQAACHPGLVDPTLLAERSGKLDLVLPMLEEIVRSGRKAIVFSSFTRLLGLVRTRLETRRLPYLVLEGRTRDRGALVDRFQNDPTGMVFLISIKAGGAGLNLTAGDYVFLLDPWWNPAVEAQAIDRAHRIGREGPVHVYRVLTEGTIEDRVVELQTKKAKLADAVLAGAATTLADLGPDDLAFLLS